MKKGYLFLVGCAILVVSIYTTAWSAKKEAPPPAPQGASDFGSMMNQLSQSLAIWSGLSAEDKARAVQAVIDLYKARENIAILKPAEFYVKRVDNDLVGDSPLKTMGLLTVIKLISVMEYDFYNGENKDELAKKVLGEKMFESNKRRVQLMKMQGGGG